MHRKGNLGDRLIIELTISPISDLVQDLSGAVSRALLAASAFSTRLVALLTALRMPGAAARWRMKHILSIGLIEFELELGIDHIQEGFEIGASRLDIQAVAIADSTDAFHNCSVISMSKPNDFGARNDDQVKNRGRFRPSQGTDL